MLNESILHNLQYALVWDSLRPFAGESGTIVFQSGYEVATVWLSFSKVRKIAANYSFLMVTDPDSQTDKRVVELSNENKHLLSEDAELFLIEKPLVQFKLAIENKQQIPVAIKQNLLASSEEETLVRDESDLIAVNEETKEQEASSKHQQDKPNELGPKRQRNIGSTEEKDEEMTSSEDESNSEQEDQQMKRDQPFQRPSLTKQTK